MHVQGQTRARVGEQGIERESSFRVQRVENFLERKGVKSFCAERIWQSILSYIYQIYIISSTAVYTIIYKNSDLPFILLNTPSLL